MMETGPPPLLRPVCIVSLTFTNFSYLPLHSID